MSVQLECGRSNKFHNHYLLRIWKETGCWEPLLIRFHLSTTLSQMYEGPLYVHGRKVELYTGECIHWNKTCQSAKSSQVFREAYMRHSEMQESFIIDVALNEPTTKVLTIPFISHGLNWVAEKCWLRIRREKVCPQILTEILPFLHYHCQHEARKNILQFASENTAELTSRGMTTVLASTTR